MVPTNKIPREQQCEHMDIAHYFDEITLSDFLKNTYHLNISQVFPFGCQGENAYQCLTECFDKNPGQKARIKN